MNQPRHDGSGPNREDDLEVAAQMVINWRGHPFLELRCYAELARLLVDPVLHGRGIPHGDGRSVLLLPGLLASDSSLWLLARFLHRIGYHPVRCGIRFNSGCGDAVDQRIVRRLVHEHTRTGRRVAVVGHSRGGHYARSLATRHPERVSHVVTMGSGLDDPLDVSVFTNRAVVAMRTMVTRYDTARLAYGCLTRGCTCDFSRGFALPFPAEVRLTSIYSRTDGVVRWSSCITDYATCVEVRSSHIGMAINPHVYRALAHALSVPPANETASAQSGPPKPGPS